MVDKPFAYVCSPFRGDTKKNLKMAREYSRRVYEAGYAPLAPHLLFPQFLNDNIAEERAAGIEMSNTLLARCSLLVVCGEKISEGMTTEIKLAAELNITTVALDRLTAPDRAIFNEGSGKMNGDNENAPIGADNTANQAGYILKAFITNTDSMTSMFSDIERLKNSDYLGAWHYFPTTGKEFQAALKELNTNGGNIMVSNCESSINYLTDRLNGFISPENMDELNYLAVRLQGLTGEQLEVFEAVLETEQHDSYGDQYKRWSRDALPLLPELWKYTASESKSKQLSVLRELMNRADVEAVVCATDAGREGELIFRLVYDYCQCGKRVQRLWINSMEEKAITDGFENLKDGAEYDRLYKAADCRQKADFIVGINATRIFSTLYGTTLSVGRVQSPTLAMIVDRDAAIDRFTAEPFYTPEINCGTFTAYGDRQKDAETAEVIRAACDRRDVVCLSVERYRKTISPPLLYDPTTLQREANRFLGYTAQQTLDYMQSLYENGAASYPRSDSRYLTSDMEDGLPELIERAADMLPFDVKWEDSVNTSYVIDNSKVSDHTAIIPTTKALTTDLSTFSTGELNILHMLAVRLLCATAPAHSYETVTAVFECGGHKFRAKGRTVLHDGWKSVESAFRSMLKNKRDEENEGDGDALPELAENQMFPSASASVREGKTSPPRRYTEDTLLSAMETAGAEETDSEVRRGIGTPATRAATIEKLIKSGLIERQKKNLAATQKGITLIAVLPDSIKSPLLTAEWEHSLRLVENGELKESEFMDGIADMTRKLVKDYTAPVEEYLSMFGTASEKSGVVKSEDIIGLCPRCGSGVSEKSKGFFCSGRDCSFALWKNNRFFEAKKKTITKSAAAALLSEGRVFISDLYSEKTEKNYGATVVMDDTGQYVNFKLEF